MPAWSSPLEFIAGRWGAAGQGGAFLQIVWQKGRVLAHYLQKRHNTLVDAPIRHTFVAYPAYLALLLLHLLSPSPVIMSIVSFLQIVDEKGRFQVAYL